MIGSVTLDGLLEGCEALTTFLEQEVVPKAALFGVRVHRHGRRLNTAAVGFLLFEAR